MSTIQEALDRLWPDASTEAKDAIGWITPYPFVSDEKVIESLEAMRAKWGPNIKDAIDGEMAEFDRIWEQTRHLREAQDNE